MTIDQALELVGQHIDEMPNDDTRKALCRAEAALEDLKRLGYEDVKKTCKHCGAPLFALIRAHHHTEEGKDVTGI